MKRLLMGVGVAMSAIAIAAGIAADPGTASADGPTFEFDGLEELAGVEFGDLSDLPTANVPEPAPANPAPAAPVEQPSLENGDAAGAQPASSGQQPAAPAGATGPIALPSTGTGFGDGGSALIIAGFATIFALAGLACFGGVRVLEAVRARAR